ncbi:MAG: ABC transporter permease [Tepidisphaerales bacterium]
MGNLWNDIQHSLQMFFKNPGFTIAALAALALGIGANTAIFTVVNAVLLKPLSYPDADHMVEFIQTTSNGSAMLASNLASIPMFHVYQQQTSVLKEVAAYDFTSPGFNFTGDRPEQLHGIHVTESYFRLFGAQSILGRTFTPEEDSPHGGKVVVLSYGLWQRKFGGDPDIVGKSLSLGNEPHTIVGVIGQQFFSDPDADIWLPFQFEPLSNNKNEYFQAAALLKPGITIAQANAQMRLATEEYYHLYPRRTPGEGVGFAIEPLRDLIVGDARKSMLVMLGAVSLVLLIACANVANLLLVRAMGRGRELAIRAALGANRGRIIRQLLTESVLLSMTGGTLGLALGFAGVRTLLAVSPAGLPRIGENGAAVGIDWRVLGFTLAVSLATGILFGLVPAFIASRTDLNTSLKESSNRSGTGFRQGKTRSLLVISEVSLALVLLIGSALLIRTFLALRGVDPGFDSRNVLTLEMSLTGERYHKTVGIAELSRDGRERLNRIPGVVVSASTVWLPNQVDDGLPFQIVGQPNDKGPLGSRWMSFSPGYLSVFKIPILRGRDFTETDTLAAPGVVLINQALEKEYWPKGDAVGQQIVIGVGMGAELVEPARTIIGVVGDTHNNGLGRPPDPMMMVPTAQVVDWYAGAYADTSALIWVVRTRAEPHQFIAAVTEQLRLASAGFPVGRVRTMEEVMGRSTARQSFNMLLLTIFGAMALVLAAIGIYAIMAYSVQQRTQEMGIRMALGADRSAIRKLVVWHGMRLATVGVVLGMAAAFGLTRLIASFLFGVKSWDPAAFLSAPLILSAVALLAAWLPATRASKLDPMQALRME